MYPMDIGKHVPVDLCKLLLQNFNFDGDALLSLAAQEKNNIMWGSDSTQIRPGRHWIILYNYI